jgi:multicomponent Na+:H+ antiporter subunit G
MTALGYALAATGTALIAIAALGLLRLPDPYNRANAVAKAAALGVVGVLLGAAALMPDQAVTLALGAVLQLLTMPFGSYAVGRAVHRSTRRRASSTSRTSPAVRSPPWRRGHGRP